MKLHRLRLLTAAAIFLAVSAPAATLTVTSAADAGGTCPGANCTLRQAIATAGASDTINFASGLTTITLTSGELAITRNLIIAGPGANLLTVQRDAAAPPLFTSSMSAPSPPPFPVSR